MSWYFSQIVDTSKGGKNWVCLYNARCQSEGLIQNSTEFLIVLRNLLEQIIHDGNQMGDMRFNGALTCML